MVFSGVSMDKMQLRRQLQAHLAEISVQDRTDKSRLICRNMIDAEDFQRASVVMLYLPLPHEVDATAVILHAWQQEKTVAVPKISWQQRHMIPVEITSLETGFSNGSCGLRNPITGVPVPVEDIDVVVVPGLAFDIHGNRLGRGGSYYDRFFASEGIRAFRYGFAFDRQVIESIPVESHDKRVDFLVTEQSVIECK